RVGERRDDAADPHAEPAGGRHAVLERGQKVLIKRLGLDVASLARAHLLLETLTLHARVVELGKRVGNLDSTGEGFESLDFLRLLWLSLGERGPRKVRGVIREERRLDQLWLDKGREELI